MDGHFVPNLTYGMPIVQALDRLTDMLLDVHLMISDPARYLPAFIDAGADVVTFHVEAVPDPAPLLDRIESLGAARGLALNPATPLSQVEPYLDRCDLVLVMSVPAGFGGQPFDPVALDKLETLRSAGTGDFALQVDGGVNPDTIGDCSRAGAELFVVGSAIFRQTDYAAAVDELRWLAGSSAGS
jgi:ribulose-phosphate 3-epimerase